jgi:alpha 1,3-mannosyltransferase
LRRKDQSIPREWFHLPKGADPPTVDDLMRDSSPDTESAIEKLGGQAYLDRRAKSPPICGRSRSKSRERRPHKHNRDKNEDDGGYEPVGKGREGSGSRRPVKIQPLNQMTNSSRKYADAKQAPIPAQNREAIAKTEAIPPRKEFTALPEPPEINRDTKPAAATGAKEKKNSSIDDTDGYEPIGADRKVYEDVSILSNGKDVNEPYAKVDHDAKEKARKEKETRAKEKAEKEKQEKDKKQREKDEMAADKLEKEERKQKEETGKKQQEKEDKEKKQREKMDKDKKEKEKSHKDRLEKEAKEKERKQREKLEREQKEKAEKDRKQKEKQDKLEKTQKEKQDKLEKTQKEKQAREETEKALVLKKEKQAREETEKALVLQKEKQAREETEKALVLQKDQFDQLDRDTTKDHNGQNQVVSTAEGDQGEDFVWEQQLWEGVEDPAPPVDDQLNSAQNDSNKGLSDKERKKGEKAAKAQKEKEEKERKKTEKELKEKIKQERKKQEKMDKEKKQKDKEEREKETKEKKKMQEKKSKGLAEIAREKSLDGIKLMAAQDQGGFDSNTQVAEQAVINTAEVINEEQDQVDKTVIEEPQLLDYQSRSSYMMM